MSTWPSIAILSFCDCVLVFFLAKSTRRVYILYVSVYVCMCTFYRDGDYESIFTDLSRFPEVLKEKQVN